MEREENSFFKKARKYHIMKRVMNKGEWVLEGVKVFDAVSD